MATNDAGADALIRRRHVLYVEATIRKAPRATTTFSARSFRRFLKNWPLQTSISDVQIDSDDLAH